MHHKHIDLKAERQFSPKVLLVGSPNVGKSAVFNALTSSYVMVSNYPGTTVDISKGKMKIGRHHQISIIDTPGMYSLRPITAEEEVSREMVIKQKPDCVVHVVDAKNLERMLSFTLQIIEAGLPVILVLNLYDELIARGMKYNIAHLEHDLGIPVVETIAISKVGIDNLSSRIVAVIEKRYNYKPFETVYSPDIEEKINSITLLMNKTYPISKRTIAVLALQNDPFILEMMKDEEHYDNISGLINNEAPNHLAIEISKQRNKTTQQIVWEHLDQENKTDHFTWKDKLSDLMIHPLWGIPFIVLVLWFGLYKFVGEFGAGTLVNFIETSIFEEIINPKVDVFFHMLLGNSILFDLFAGDYGIITLGIRYAIAIVLPIVATFFIVFSLIEDVGYLPRLAMLVDRIFKTIGLSGRAVIPIVLGFGCDTMATIVTRTLESKKERILVTFLLALAIPCSAQLGVILGILAGNPRLLLIWGATVCLIFLLTGYIGKSVLKGQDTLFFMELPPLRLPIVTNIFTKTYTRMAWYFKEVFPIFIAASAIIWFGKMTGLFDILVKLISYPVTWAGMPAAAAPAFLYGFFRRDFGAAGLFDLAKSGALEGDSLLIATVVLTLFVPCVAQFAITWKERGKLMAIGMAAFIFPFSFFVGFLLKIIIIDLKLI